MQEITRNRKNNSVGAAPFPDVRSQEGGRHIYTVSHLVREIKVILENAFGQVWVEGEISNFQAASSGHFYFTLKEGEAILPAAMFVRANREVKFKIENGQKVICFGQVSVYGPRGQYQVIVEKIEPKGIGALQLALEQLKHKLEKEGLFDPAHKRPIPYLPSRIGVVTSLDGAAIKDILKVLDRRFSHTDIIIRPAQVQGEGAGKEVASAIKEINLFNERLVAGQKIEVMIVGRGGGSIEDLWAFNEELVARAIYGSAIPVISAVGHERDWTIADLVSDLRAATPSAAAELVIPEKEDLKDRLDMLCRDIGRGFLDIVSERQERIVNLLRHLRVNTEHLLALSQGRYNADLKKLLVLNPATVVGQYRVRIMDLAKEAHIRFLHFIKLREAQLKAGVQKLAGLSPLAVLGRGYSITFKMPESLVIKDAGLVNKGDTLKTKLHAGEVLSRVVEVKRAG